MEGHGVQGGSDDHHNWIGTDGSEPPALTCRSSSDTACPPPVEGRFLTLFGSTQHIFLKGNDAAKLFMIFFFFLFF